MSIDREVSQRRTFAIISHPDAGKTTLTEKLLHYGGLAFQSNPSREVSEVKALVAKVCSELGIKG